MVLAKSKNAVGLGNSLMNDRFGKGKGNDRKKVTTAGITRINHATGESVRYLFPFKTLQLNNITEVLLVCHQ